MKLNALGRACWVVLVGALVAACATTPEPTATTAPVEVQAPTAPSAEEPCVDLELPGDLAGMCWDDILEEADGQTVVFYHWGGSSVYNTFWAETLGGLLKDKFGITLKTVPVALPTEFVDKIVNEAAAGVDEGSVDLVWINSENFRTVKQAGALYGPYAQKLPNSIYVDWSNPKYIYDAGTPTEGYESPQESAQPVMIYDSACVPEPPTSIYELKQWIMDNPGKFTYTAPPEFTATAMLSTIFYETTGGYDQWQGAWDEAKQALFDEKSGATWAWLNEIEPYLWREGETYPESLTQLDDLFVNGEVCFSWNVWPLHAQTMINQGLYPDTARSFVFDEGTVALNAFFAIPKNAPHKAAALVVSNYVMSPEIQLMMADPKIVGNLPGVTFGLLPEDAQAAYAALDLGEATVPYDELFAHAIPQFSGKLVTVFEQGWEENVMRK